MDKQPVAKSGFGILFSWTLLILLWCGKNVIKVAFFTLVNVMNFLFRV
jgi:hypothetical protein